MREEELDALLQSLPQPELPPAVDAAARARVVAITAARAADEARLDAMIDHVRDAPEIPPDVDRQARARVAELTRARRGRSPWWSWGAGLAAAAAVGLVVGVGLPGDDARVKGGATGSFGTVELRADGEVLSVQPVGYRPHLTGPGTIRARWVALPDGGAVGAWWVPADGERVALDASGLPLPEIRPLPDHAVAFTPAVDGTLVLVGVGPGEPLDGLMEAIDAGRSPQQPIGGAVFVAVDVDGVAR